MYIFIFYFKFIILFNTIILFKNDSSMHNQHSCNHSASCCKQDKQHSHCLQKIKKSSLNICRRAADGSEDGRLKKDICFKS